MVISNLKRFLLLMVVPLAAALGADADPVDIVRRSLSVENENAKRARNYTFLQREEQRQLDGNGQVKSKSVKTWDVTMLEGSAYRRLIERDDHPLPEREEQQEQAKLRKSIEERRHETEAERAKRLADYEKRPGRNRGVLNEIPDAFNFRLRGEESIASRPVKARATRRAMSRPQSSSTSATDISTPVVTPALVYRESSRMKMG